MNILGVSAYYHDSAAALIQDGEVVAAVQEERFNRIKNSPAFPAEAINYCLQQADITVNDLDCIVFYEKPFLKFSRVMVNHLRSYPFSFRNFMRTTPAWLENRLIMPLVFKKEIGYRGKVYFSNHHTSHAASSFFLSPFDSAAIVTADGIGEWTTASIGEGRGINLNTFYEMNYPHSLGLIYSAITTYLGFRSLSGEGKVMGLASYGNPEYLDALRAIINLKNDGSCRVDEK